MTNGLRCEKCLLQRFDGNHVIHLGYLLSFSERRDCRLCAFVLAQLVKTRAFPNSLVFLKPVPKSPTTYAIIFDDVESETVEGWISLSSDLSTYGQSHNGSGNKLDREQIKRWLHECETTHHHSYMTDVVGQDLVDLVLIDVKNGMLVDAEPEWEFAALSYVNGRWGGEEFNLKDFTKDDLEAPGMLFSSAVTLPAVLSDAIELVRDLGQRYLWCDYICIFSDSHAQKQAQIRQMDAIYGKAILTIIALSADHGNMPLPGVREDSRDSICPIVDLDHGRKAEARAPELEVIKSRSEYTLRGWTFQEEVLSRRCLYLTDSQAYFTCPGGYKREDKHLAAEPTRLSHSDLFSSFGQAMSSTRLPVEHLFSLYGTLLRIYNTRRLTFDTDILDAFHGISQILSRQFSTNFIFGLPQSQLHHALLWVPRTVLERRFPTVLERMFPMVPMRRLPTVLQQRLSKIHKRLLNEVEEQNDSVQLVGAHHFENELRRILQPPTWSWAAWRGEVGFFIPRNEPLSTDSWIQHFGLLEPGGILPVDALENQGNSHLHLLPRFMLLEEPAIKLLPYGYDAWKLTEERNLHYLSIPFERMELFDLQLFVLDLLRAGVTLIYGMVRTLLEKDGKQPELPVDLEEHKIRDALGQWQSILQGSPIQLDSCPPTPTELMQSWTAIRDNLTLTYNGRPIWPFKSWFRDQSASASCYASKRLSWFLDNHIQPRQLEERVMMAMKRKFGHLERFALTPQNALCFFTYSTQTWNFFSGGQLHESSLKHPGSMTTKDGVMCDLETLQFSKHDGIVGEVERPVIAVGIANLERRRRIAAAPDLYAGVLFGDSEKLLLYEDARLLFLSCGPPYNGSGTLKYRTWNMMLVCPLENGFYERLAVGRFREDVMVHGRFTWECKYIRLA